MASWSRLQGAPGHVCVCTGSPPYAGPSAVFTLLHQTPTLDCSGVLRRSVLGLSWEVQVLGSLGRTVLGLTSWEAKQREICRLRFPLEKVTQATDVFQRRDLPKRKPSPWLTLPLKPSLATPPPSAQK